MITEITNEEEALYRPLSPIPMCVDFIRVRIFPPTPCLSKSKESGWK
jgi:hypothetical protein